MNEAKTEIKAIIAKALAAAKGDWEKAAQIAAEKIAKKRTLKDAIFAECVQGHVWYLIREASRHKRTDFFNGRSAPTEDRKSFEAAAAAIALQHWYEMPLPGGTLLGDATAEDLRAAFDFWTVQAQTNASRAAWVSKILAKVPAGRVVRDVLSEKQIAALSAGLLREAA
jgi:hypothetical protein